MAIFDLITTDGFDDNFDRIDQTPEFQQEFDRGIKLRLERNPHYNTELPNLHPLRKVFSCEFTNSDGLLYFIEVVFAILPECKVELRWIRLLATE